MSATVQVTKVPEEISIDPVTVEVLGSAFLSISEEMGEALVKASYSTNIKERRDCSTALFDVDGRTLCQAEHIPMHLGSFLGFIPLLLQRYPVSTIVPGDVFIGNDAYEGGGTHLPDFVLAEPVFVGGEVVAWAINTAHHSDFADRGHAHIYQEGLRIPPVRLMAGGKLEVGVQDMILANCQVPRERLSDLRAQLAANRLGVQRMKALHERYGTPTVLAAGRELQDYAERRMRSGIEKIADGTYEFEDVFESIELPNPMPLKVAITVAGSEMKLVFDAPPQVRAGANLIYTALLSAVYYAVKAVVDPEVPPNAGMARPISVEAPLGSLLNCVHPAAVNGRMGPAQRVVDLVHGALGKALPARIPAASASATVGALFSGVRPDNGKLWVYLEAIGGGGGARPTKDGMSGIQVHLTNTSNLPVEALEQEYPLTLLAYELAEGSGGKGEFRGGLGLRRIYRTEAPCRLEVDAARLKSAPWGSAGGEAGGNFSCLIDGKPAVFNLGLVELGAGQVVEISSPGGGGYGPATARGAALIQRDLNEGR